MRMKESQNGSLFCFSAKNYLLCKKFPFNEKALYF